MTTEEFSNEFDVLLNSYSQNISIVAQNSIQLDEYEKSLYLTAAQEDIVKSLYTGTLTGKSLEETEELRRSLDSLIVTDYPDSIARDNGLDKNSTFYQLKDDVWFITYESAELSEDAYCKNNPVVKVIPMKQDEWHRSKDNPFKRPNKRKVVRLDCGGNIVELISPYTIQNYLVRYLRKPNPIILANLDGLTIDYIGDITECELNSALHRIILERAVTLASSRVAASK